MADGVMTEAMRDDDGMGVSVHCTKHGICRMKCISPCNTHKPMTAEEKTKFGLLTLAARERAEKFERIVEVTPAYDKRHDDPKKDYGIGACRIWFYLKGSKGTVQFQIGTDWEVPSARTHLLKFNHVHRNFNEGQYFKPQGWDLGYHSPKPMYESHTPMDRECPFVEGGECYYDGSGLNAEAMIEGFVAGGTEWLWPRLEEYYHEVFDEPQGVEQ